MATPDMDGLPAGGVYQLLVEVGVDGSVAVGRLGRIELRAGWYVYTGSARRALRSRLARHLRWRKKRHWHIDYVLRRRGTQVRAFRVVVGPAAVECTVNQATCDLAGVEAAYPGFGASDCRNGCVSHLARVGGAEIVTFKDVAEALRADGPGPWQTVVRKGPVRR